MYWLCCGQAALERAVEALVLFGGCPAYSVWFTTLS